MTEILRGVLSMPDDLFWSDDPITREQHNSIRREAAQRIDALESERDRLQEYYEAAEALRHTGLINATDWQIDRVRNAREAIAKAKGERL